MTASRLPEICCVDIYDFMILYILWESWGVASRSYTLEIDEHRTVNTHHHNNNLNKSVCVCYVCGKFPSRLIKKTVRVT